MTVNAPLLLLALLMILFPRAWLRLGVTLSGRRGRKGRRARATEPWRTREPGDPRLNFRREFTRFQNYFDLLRAGAGGLLLLGGMGLEPSLAAAAGASPASLKEAIALRWFILMAGVLVQTLRFERGRVTFYPPVFYLAGLSVGLCGVTSAFFAFAMIWAVNVAIGSAQAFLALYGLLIMAFSRLFAGRTDLSVVVAGLLCFLPVLLSLLSRRPLVVLSRKASHGGAG